MYKTNQNNCHYLDFIGVWKTLLGSWLYIAVVVFISAQIAMFAAQPAQAAQAAPEEHILNNPPVLEFLEFRQPIPLNAPKSISDDEREEEFGCAETVVPNVRADKQLDLKIEYVTAKIRNPATGKDDNVNLRAYVGTETSVDTPYVAPTIEVYPSDTVRINLHNNLPSEENCTEKGNNTFHCFNSSNLHSHGLWISPAGNSDNVLVSISPKESFTYEYNIPDDHPAGTFWYHPHRHGSTAAQVASGMAGALIVCGRRAPQWSQSGNEFINGDIDTLLKGLEYDMQDRVLVLQQIQYACGQNQDGSINWNCNGKVGEIEYKNLDFSPNSWGDSGRYTSINGEVIPTINEATQGKIERWRMIHGGVRDTINLEFRKKRENADNYLKLAAKDAESWIEENCPGSAIDYYIIAEDGLTRSEARKTILATLQPGYRSDALVVFPEAGEYCVIDTSAPASQSVRQVRESRQLLAVVEVNKGNEVGNIEDYMKKQLISAAEKQFQQNEKVKNKVVEDINNPNAIKLTLFEPHPQITDGEVAHTHRQEMAFFIDTSTTPVEFKVSNGVGSSFDPKSYDPNRIDRKLKLGDAEEWALTSYVGGHPFHIHVNPFQIVKILDPNGKDVSVPEATDDFSGQPDPEYPGLKGVWKDTIFVKQDYTVVVRTRYERYIGKFVQHCHILDHEDQGMMQNISIVLPSELSK
ncbi:MAG: multicopper oxidase domain-containing protein [Cyanobacteriota bacterium]|nr:multicopper oxidase domain-containing protein [Cyanobacteriota bacterium]